jgi:hypothetical protein
MSEVDRPPRGADTDGERKWDMPEEIVVQDSDDRSERMIRDPERYFAEARKRAEEEVRREVEGRVSRAVRREHTD